MKPIAVNEGVMHAPQHTRTSSVMHSQGTGKSQTFDSKEQTCCISDEADGPRLPTKTSPRNCTPPPPHPTPLRKHLESQENELDKAVLVRNAWYHNMSLGTYVTENLPIPHPKHNCCNRHTVQTNFSKFWRSSLPISGIRSCGIEALPNLAPHLKQVHMLANWGRLWSRLGFRFWNGGRLPIPWDKTVISNIFSEIKLALKPCTFLMYFK